MKKYKFLIIFILILGVYGLVMYFVFGTNNGYDNQNNNNNGNKTNNVNEEKKYLVIGNISNNLFSNGSFSKVSTNEIEKIEKYKVYVNNKFYGDYKLKHVNNWNLFDKSNEYVHYNGSLIAFSTNFNVKVRDYKVRQLNDKEKNALKNDYKLPTFSSLITNQVVDFDLDSNGVLDQIICITNMDENDNIKNNFSILFIKLNDEKITLIEEKESDAKYVYSIYAIINIDVNNKDGFVISKTEGYISEKPKVSNLIYNYKNDKYVID